MTVYDLSLKLFCLRKLGLSLGILLYIRFNLIIRSRDYFYAHRGPASLFYRDIYLEYSVCTLYIFDAEISLSSFFSYYNKNRYKSLIVFVTTQLCRGRRVVNCICAPCESTRRPSIFLAHEHTDSTTADRAAAEQQQNSSRAAAEQQQSRAAAAQRERGN